MLVSNPTVSCKLKEVESVVRERQIIIIILILIVTLGRLSKIYIARCGYTWLDVYRHLAI